MDRGALPVDQRTKQTPYERKRGALVPFGEVVMAKIADAVKMRAGKLDSACVKAVWVGRVDKSNEHLLLTTKGCIRSRVVRRIPESNQASYHAEVQASVAVGHTQRKWRNVEECDGQAGEPPRPSRGRPRKDGSPAQARTTTTTGQEATRDDPMPGSSDDHLRQPTSESDVIEQNIVMDSGNARVSDDGAHQGVLRMGQEEGVSAEEQARRRLRSKQPARRSLTDDATVSKRRKREATIAAIKQEILKNCTERPDLEQAHNFYASIRTLRGPESIHASR